MKIFFDVDGVLIDGWHANPKHRRPWDASIEQDLGIDRKIFQQALFVRADNQSQSLMVDCAAGKRDLKEVLSEILPKAGYHGTVDSFVTYWFEKDSHINPDVLGIVAQLRERSDVELYLATGQEHYRAAYLWNELGFSKYFKDMLYAAKLGHHKNTPEFFHAINKALDITPAERPLFFDDHEGTVQTANAAGWDAFVFETSQDLVSNARLRPYLSN